MPLLLTNPCPAYLIWCWAPSHDNKTNCTTNKHTEKWLIKLSDCNFSYPLQISLFTLERTEHSHEKGPIRRTNRCTLAQRPLFPWQWLGSLARSHMMQVRSLICGDGVLTDPAFSPCLHSCTRFSPHLRPQPADAGFIEETAWWASLPFNPSDSFLEEHAHIISARQEHDHSNTPLKLRCRCYDVHLRHLPPAAGVSVKCEWTRNKRCVTAESRGAEPSAWLQLTPLMMSVALCSCPNSSLTRTTRSFETLSVSSLLEREPIPSDRTITIIFC